jgi:quaternary ammonium compound-resistance protein SugE
MVWLYLAVAALFETAWTFCVKFLKFGNFKLLMWSNFYKMDGVQIIAPLLGYIAFGLLNVYFFSLAINQISTAVAFAVWTALTLTFIKLAELLLFKQGISWLELFFMMLIMVGISGLKASHATV